MIKILTLSWNGLDKLKNLRDGLERNLRATGQDWKWYIRDNGSTDNTVEEISKWENVTVLPISHNRDNFAQGINSLTKDNYADEDYYLFLNNDVEFNDDISLINMLALFEKDNKISAVGALLTYPNTEIIQHAGTIFSSRYGNMCWHYRAQERIDKYSIQDRYFQAITAAVALVKCRDFHAVGGMNNLFNWAFDDVDFFLKLKYRLNKKIAFCGKTNVSHTESASLKKNPVNKLFLLHNVKIFKDLWWGNNKPLYEIDHQLYLDDPNYNVIQ